MQSFQTLFLEFHSTESGLKHQTETVDEIAKDMGGSDFEYAVKQEDRNRLWTARHKLYYGLSSKFTPQCLKITQNIAFEFLAFSTNFCRTKTDLSGNTV